MLTSPQKKKLSYKLWVRCCDCTFRLSERNSALLQKPFIYCRLLTFCFHMVPAILTFLAEQVGAKKNIGQCILQHIPTFSLFWLQRFFFGTSNENTFKINDLPHHEKSIHRRAVCPMDPDDFTTIWVSMKSHTTKKAKQTQNSFGLKSSTFSCLTTMVYTIYESIKYLNKVLHVQ